MCGCHIGGKTIVEEILDKGYKFDYFVCLNPKQSEKYDISGYYDFTYLAEVHKIPVYYPNSYSLKSKEDILFFNENRFDLLIQGGWQRLFPIEVLSALSIGALGYHGSSDPLPKGRGRSPLNWSLIENKKRFIMNLFLIKPGIDDGDVIDSFEFDINELDDINTLYYKYAIANRDLVLRNIEKLFNKKYQVYPQIGKPSYYPKRSKTDGEIDWEEMDVYEIYNLVRACTKPYPGAFGTVSNSLLKIWKAQIFDTRINYPLAKYGEIVEQFDSDLIVKCRGGLLLIQEYQKYDV